MTTYVPDNGNMRIPSRDEFHNHFSGYVYNTDFGYPMSVKDVATRVAADLRFDRRCGKNITSRNKTRRYKNEIRK